MEEAGEAARIFMPHFAEFFRIFIPFFRHIHSARAARREVRAIGTKLRFKLRTQGKLSLVERHLLRSYPSLERQLCGPSISTTCASIGRSLVKPAIKCSVSGFILIGAASSFPSNSAWKGIPEAKVAEAEIVGSSNPKVEMPKLAMALAREARASFSLELDKNVDFGAPTTLYPPAPVVQLPVSTEAPARVTSPEEEALKKAEYARQIRLNNQRGLVKFISGIIAAFRPTIGDCGEIARLIVELSERENIDPIYVASVIAVESRFSSSALSGAGARGLMQLMPMTAQELADSPLHRTSHLSDPRTNINLGIQYLKQLEQRYRGNKFLVLAAYNWGPANVDNVRQRYQNIPSSVRRYSNTVIERTISWRRHYDKATEGANAIQTAVQPTIANGTKSHS